MDFKWYIIVVGIMMVSMVIGNTIERYNKQNAIVKIQCYEAAKTNQNIKCE